MSVEALLPLAVWDHSVGNSVLVQVFDANQQCTIQLCQNNVFLNGICVFRSTASELLVRVENTVSTSLTFSLNAVYGTLSGGNLSLPTQSPFSICPLSSSG